MEIVDRLSQHIKAKKLKVSEVAVAVGIPTERLRKWLKGLSKPKFDDTAKIEAYLVGGIPDKVPENSAVSYSKSHGSQVDSVTTKYITALERENERLAKILEVSLVELTNEIKVVQGQIKGTLHYIAAKAAGGDPKRLKVELDEISKKISDMVEVSERNDTRVRT